MGAPPPQPPHPPPPVPRTLAKDGATSTTRPEAGVADAATSSRHSLIMDFGGRDAVDSASQLAGVEWRTRASEGSACDGGSGPRFKHHGGSVPSRRPRPRPAASQPGCLHFLVPRSRPMCMSDTAAQRQDPAVIFKTDAIGITPLHRVGRFSTRESAGRSAGCKLTFSPDSGGQPPAHRAVLGGAGRERECGGQIQ